LKVHHGKSIAEYVGENKDKIEIFYLPSYAPERNHDEYLNGNLKREIAKRGHSKSIEDLRSNTNKIMRKFQKNTEHVKRYFESKFISYAAGNTQELFGGLILQLAAKLKEAHILQRTR
jgi:hypothetical protein